MCALGIHKELNYEYIKFILEGEDKVSFVIDGRRNPTVIDGKKDLIVFFYNSSARLHIFSKGFLCITNAADREEADSILCETLNILNVNHC